MAVYLLLQRQIIGATHHHRYYINGRHALPNISAIFIEIIISTMYLLGNNLLFVLIEAVSGYSGKALTFGVAQRSAKIN